MLFARSLVIIIIIICLGNGTVCLGGHEAFSDLGEQIIKENPKCTTVLHNLGAVTTSMILSASNVPLLMMNDHKNQDLDTIRELLSARKSNCAIILAQDDTLHGSVIEHVVNQTTRRTVYVWKITSDVTQMKFAPYFMDSVIEVRPCLPGENLQLTSSVHSKRMLWLKHGKKIVASDAGFTLTENRDRSTLRGKSVIVSAVPIIPYVTILPNKKYGGAEIEHFKIISGKIGFTYHIKEEKYLEFRDPVTKKWSGTVGSVINGTSHFGTSLKAATGFGVSVPVHFPQPLNYVEYNYLVPKPKPLKPFANFFRPFKMSVWLCFLASFILCSILAVKLNRGVKSLTSEKVVFDLFSSMWQQNAKVSHISPNSGTYFILFGFWTIAIFFKGAAYNCNLRMYMMKVDFEPPIETNEDILAHGIDLYVPAGYGLEQELQFSASPTKRALYDRIVAKKTLFFFKDGAVTPTEEKMIREGGARIINKIRGAYILDTYEKYLGYQPLQATKFSVLGKFGGTVMPLYQPWTDEVDIIILRLLAAGIMDSLVRKYVPADKSTDDDNEDVLVPYSIDHVAGPLSVLGSGLILSLIVAVMEHLHWRYFVFT